MKTHPNLLRLSLLLACASLLAPSPASLAATLTHRYSFSEVDDGAGNMGALIHDSVGGTTWNGVLPNGGTFSGDQLQLLQGSSQYAQLPSGIISNYTTITVDLWATYGTLPGACFAWAFGYTDSGGGGGNCIFLQPKQTRVSISGGDPSWQAGEQTAQVGGDWSGQTIHVTAVVNPPLGYIALYTNGYLASVNLSETVPLSSVSNQLAYIARSLYTADSYMDVSVDEYRIWNGALNPLEVAGQDLAGPDTVSLNYGTVNGLSLQVPSPIAIGAAARSAVTLTASGLAGPIQLQTPDLPIAYTSANPSIATANPTNGTVTGIASGTVNIIASYAGYSATQAVQVISLPTTMIHRYSFNDGTANDSVGTANGTFYNDSGVSSISGGALKLAGTDKGDYVDLGSYLVSSTNIANNAATLEAWVTVYPGNGVWTRIWDFGNISGTIGNSSGQNYWSFMPTIGNANNGVSRTELAFGGNLDVDYSGHTFQGWTNVHVVGVFNPNPSRQFLGIYLNGKLVNSGNTGSRTLAGLNDAYSWLGRSLWSGDSALAGEIDEFRIYNGELDKFQIAASDQAGPNTTNFNLGTFTSFVLDAGTTPLPLNGQRTAAAYMNFTLVTNVLVTGDPNLAWSSDNTNVFTVSSAGVITGTGVGTSTLRATYKYIVGATTNTYTGSTAVPVYRDQPVVLAHRYLFATDASDAMNAGGVWDGTTPNGATYLNGQVVLDNSLQQYVQLPAGILSNYTAVTIESWVSSNPTNGTFSFFYGFGDTDTGGAGDYYIFGSLNRNYAAITGVDPGYTGEQGIFGGPSLAGTTNLHWTAVYNPPAGYIALYTNGVLAGMNSSVTIPMSATTNVLNYIGRSLYTGDPYPNLSVDEFRIYNGVLHADEVAATQVLGPNQTLTTSARVSVAQSAGNLVLSWPVGAAGFTLQSRSSLTAGTWTPVTTAVPQIVGSTWQITVPRSGNLQFYRLSR